MATQNVDFTTSSDTGENVAAAIAPVVNGEPGDATIFNRPTENLRVRTETVKQTLEDLKYLADADRSLVLDSDQPATWTSGTGILSLPGGGHIWLQPFLSVLANTPAQTTFGDATHTVQLQTITAPTSDCPAPLRAYSGANKVSVLITTVNNPVFTAPVITRTGQPADDINITVNVHASAGTTCQQLVDAINSSTPMLQLGILASTNPGSTGNIVAVASGTLLTFSGAADAELHTITSAGLATFFSSNPMVDGDVLAIYYPDLVDGGYGGRRQSLTSAPESSGGTPDRTNVDNNLFLVRTHPEWLPLALPIARRIGTQLYFINGVMIPSGIPSSIFPPVTGSYVLKTGDTMTDQLVVNATAATPAVSGTGGGTNHQPGLTGTGGVTNGVGVSGYGPGTGAGVSGTSVGGYGVLGTGIMGVAGNGAVGVQGRCTGGTGNGVVGYGGSTGGVGVYGEASATGAAGVRGKGKGNGDGVIGASAFGGGANGVSGTGDGAGHGVKGTGGTTGYGVYGTSAVYGICGATTGVTGVADGVRGMATSFANGVHGLAEGGPGVWGESSAAVGVYGTGPIYGVSGSGGIGVYGAGAGSGAGVSGEGGTDGPGGTFQGNNRAALHLEPQGVLATNIGAPGDICADATGDIYVYIGTAGSGAWKKVTRAS